MGWNLPWTFGPLLHGKFHPHRCNVSPLRGEKPQNRPLSKLNTGRFALRAMLPVNMSHVNNWPNCTRLGWMPRRFYTWEMETSAEILQNQNAHKELQPICETYCRKLCTVWNCITKVYAVFPFLKINKVVKYKNVKNVKMCPEYYKNLIGHLCVRMIAFEWNDRWHGYLAWLFSTGHIGHDCKMKSAVDWLKVKVHVKLENQFRIRGRQELIRRWDSERELFLQHRTCRGQRLRPLNEFVISTKHLRYLPTHQTDF